MKSEIFVYELLIRESHLDTFSHVNNATYLQILEEARWEIITHRGFGLKEIAQTGLGPVILEINIKFLKELKLRQRIAIRSQLESYENKIGLFSQKIENQNGDLCCEALFKIGLFDTKARKLVSPTREWLAAVGVKQD